MNVYEKEIFIPAPSQKGSLIEYISQKVAQNLTTNEIPIRFVVTRSGEAGFSCELGILVTSNEEYPGASTPQP
jgi:hypothetical protein